VPAPSNISLVADLYSGWDPRNASRLAVTAIARPDLGLLLPRKTPGSAWCRAAFSAATYPARSAATRVSVGLRTSPVDAAPCPGRLPRRSHNLPGPIGDGGGTREVLSPGDGAPGCPCVSPCAPRTVITVPRSRLAHASRTSCRAQALSTILRTSEIAKATACSPFPCSARQPNAVTCLILPIHETKRTATSCGSFQGTLIHQQQRQLRLRTRSVGRASNSQPQLRALKRC
jgi:hypothetical protein